jgi:ribosomal protein L36
MIDLDELQIINAEDVPASRIRVRRWRAVLERIPKGKALVLDETFKVDVLRVILRRFRHKGLFSTYKVCERNGRVYVIHPTPKKKASVKP